MFPIALLNLIDRPHRAAARMHEAEAAARADLGRLSTALSSGGGPAAGGKAILEMEDEFEGEDEDQVEDRQDEDQVEIQDSGAEAPRRRGDTGGPARRDQHRAFCSGERRRDRTGARRPLGSRSGTSPATFMRIASMSELDPCTSH